MEEAIEQAPLVVASGLTGMASRLRASGISSVRNGRAMPFELDQCRAAHGWHLTTYLAMRFELGGGALARRVRHRTEGAVVDGQSSWSELHDLNGPMACADRGRHTNRTVR